MDVVVIVAERRPILTLLLLLLLFTDFFFGFKMQHSHLLLVLSYSCSQSRLKQQHEETIASSLSHAKEMESQKADLANGLWFHKCLHR